MRLLSGQTFGQLPSVGVRRSILLSGLACGAFTACQTTPPAQGDSIYPALGRRLLVTFPAFRAELSIHSSSSLTWFLLNPDGSKGRSETVKVRIQPVTGQVFLVTWQEANKTTVVQVQDFARNEIFTSITRPDGTFLQSKGSFVQA